MQAGQAGQAVGQAGQLGHQVGHQTGRRTSVVCHDGRLSVNCFLAGIVPVLLIPLADVQAGIGGWALNLLAKFAPYLLPGHLALCYAAAKLTLNGHQFKVGVRAGFLGWAFALGFYMSFLGPPSWRPFGWYTCVMSFFHYSEYLTTAVINPQSLVIDSFLLNHSREYCIAAVASWFEFWIERWFYPDMKEHINVTLIGLAMCIVGEFLRKLAMLTAKSNFNHLIQNVRADGHTLITHGVYSIFRHPSYVGWFYWSIGTQIIMCNPICLLAYTLASWQFFRERILVEEVTLVNFFGEDYVRYQKKVGTGLPFIKGYRVEL